MSDQLKYNLENPLTNLQVDENGRLKFVGGTLNYCFRSFPKVIASDELIKKLIEDCKIAFTAKTQQTSNQYSEGQTFWVGATDKPTTLLETIAQMIFTFHTKHAVFDIQNSGAEWWPLVLNLDDEVGFHWDKDYNLEDYEANIYPHIATVTYLTNLGAPTLMLDHVAPLFTEANVTGSFSSGLISRPRIGKHVSFDGRFLHSAPHDLIELWNEQPESTSNKRVTLLVNIWLNHKPEDAVPLPKEFSAQVSSAPSDISFMWNEETPDHINISSESQSKDMRWKMKVNKKVRVCIKVPTGEVATAKTTSIALSWTEPNLAAVTDVKKKQKRIKT